ncbi:MAG: Methylase involved in ubiquinone/menaquinone biosynthesis [Phormidium sp. OSCR]|nr:MAG: Methylase involved in ubiquinone/menaquinone biosynthesis [Phormidium sp. OSCR]
MAPKDRPYPSSHLGAIAIQYKDRPDCWIMTQTPNTPSTLRPDRSETASKTASETASKTYDVEQVVLERYQAGADQVQPSLCCPTEYDTTYLKLIPQEILQKDYGCGDPSQYVQAGETVLDLGSGAGKICYILSQKVGANGSVIGVDFNDKMLALARKYQDEMSEKIGYQNLSFVKGKIQDLALDMQQVQDWLSEHPIHNLEDLSEFEQACDRIRRETPLIADNSLDVVVSNCVLNLVRPRDKQQLFQEIFRVLKPGGRAVISDIVSDQFPSDTILNDPDLWSGCIAGAFQEAEFPKKFEQVGFRDVEVLTRQEEPWQVVEGIEFRSLTVRAYKGTAKATAKPSRVRSQSSDPSSTPKQSCCS